MTYKDKLLFTPGQRLLAKEIILDIYENKPKCIAIGGKSGTGKSEIAYIIAQTVDNTKIICQDRYYVYDHEKRRRDDISVVGKDEISWITLNNAVGNCKHSPVYSFVIVEGLYALHCPFADRRYYLSQSYEQSYSFRKRRAKENPDCAFRQQVLKNEAIEVRSTKVLADKVLSYEEAEHGVPISTN